MVRLLCWRPTLFLRHLLLYAPRLSNPLLVQGFQECFSRDGLRAPDHVTAPLLRQLLSWLVCHSVGRAGPRTADVPSLELVLDFVTVLVDTKLPVSLRVLALGEPPLGSRA